MVSAHTHKALEKDIYHNSLPNTVQTNHVTIIGIEWANRCLFVANVNNATHIKGVIDGTPNQFRGM
jgi:hypothetical protein